MQLQEKHRKSNTSKKKPAFCRSQAINGCIGSTPVGDGINPCKKRDMRKKNILSELCRIEKRAIEALAIAPFLEGVAKRIGKESALAILQEINEQEAFQRGASLRENLEKTGIPELADDVATWGDGGKLEMEVLEQTAETYYFNITHCPYYEKYLKLGLVEYGVAFSCCRDEPFARGFHPQLKLQRSQTIMEGADYCDFRYSLCVTD